VSWRMRRSVRFHGWEDHVSFRSDDSSLTGLIMIDFSRHGVAGTHPVRGRRRGDSLDGYSTQAAPVGEVQTIICSSPGHLFRSLPPLLALLVRPPGVN